MAQFAVSSILALQVVTPLLVHMQVLRAHVTNALSVAPLPP